jgi:hypothetical protein
MKSLFETLAPLCASAALLTACGGGVPTPVNAAEVPAAVDVKPSDAPPPAKTGSPTTPVESKTGGATAGTTMTEAAPPASSSAAQAPAAPAKAAAKPRKQVAVKKDAAASCGAGTCG